ncbi:hypothetical protein GALL_406500 [mine drainage metagenome]|uniref:FlgN protein n=1 Tax=mine drainage metagenome TaxID=410659 RepID=A0A1J5QNW7_9ZZZZ
MTKSEMSADCALETLLDAELDAIRRGELSALEDLSTRTENLLESLIAGPMPDARTLERLRAKATRNAATLAAASRGVRAARRRLAELFQAAEGLDTYDASGRRNGLGANATKVERRA